MVINSLRLDTPSSNEFTNSVIEVEFTSRPTRLDGNTTPHETTPSPRCREELRRFDFCGELFDY
ncbi:hypothetical protein OE88DRAFT_1666181, partial [Heliocybe sulcata]